MMKNTNREYRINIHQDLTGQKFDWHLDREDFDQIIVSGLEELKEILLHKLVTRIDLKYIMGGRNELEIWNIHPEQLSAQEFSWLVHDEIGKLKFLEITSQYDIS